VITAEAAPPVGEDVKTLFAKLGEAFVHTQARTDIRLDRVELRLDRVEGRLERVEGRLDRVEGRLERVEWQLDQFEERLISLERSTQTGFNRMDARFEQLIALIQQDELKR
jgi:hypothetical protein